MTRKEMIELLQGNYIDVDYEWLLENDSEMIHWVCKSNYWGRGYEKEPEREKLWLRLHFGEDGVGYIATAEGCGVDVDQSLNNQPYWGEDEWEDWDTENIEKYYREVFSSILNDSLTISEAVKLDCVASHYKNRKSATRGLQRKLERGHSFKHGIDCRKADGEIWLVTRESLEREYKDGKNEI